MQTSPQKLQAVGRSTQVSVPPHGPFVRSLMALSPEGYRSPADRSVRLNHRAILKCLETPLSQRANNTSQSFDLAQIMTLRTPSVGSGQCDQSYREATCRSTIEAVQMKSAGCSAHISPGYSVSGMPTDNDIGRSPPRLMGFQVRHRTGTGSDVTFAESSPR
jgi:hypothetical protein